jgi:hypothetical protein
MATAHGAGLMLVPILFQLPGGAEAHSAHAAHMSHSATTGDMHSLALLPLADLAAVGLHTLAMFVVMAAIAVVVFEKLGLKLLRQAWFNLDRVWAVSLLLRGVFSLAFA